MVGGFGGPNFFGRFQILKALKISAFGPRIQKIQGKHWRRFLWFWEKSKTLLPQKTHFLGSCCFLGGTYFFYRIFGRCMYYLRCFEISKGGVLEKCYWIFQNVRGPFEVLKKLGTPPGLGESFKREFGPRQGPKKFSLFFHWFFFSVFI